MNSQRLCKYLEKDLQGETGCEYEASWATQHWQGLKCRSLLEEYSRHDSHVLVFFLSSSNTLTVPPSWNFCAKCSWFCNLCVIVHLIAMLTMSTMCSSVFRLVYCPALFKWREKLDAGRNRHLVIKKNHLLLKAIWGGSSLVPYHHTWMATTMIRVFLCKIDYTVLSVTAHE